MRSLNIAKVLLCGVFTDGCVGLTVADAEQLSYETILVDDTIGHCNEEHWSFVSEWLVGMDELRVTSVDAAWHS